MASTSAATMSMTITNYAQKRAPYLPSKPLSSPSSKQLKGKKFAVKASLDEKKVLSGVTAAAMTALMVIPDVAEAAGAGLTPSLNNFLLSIAAGGTVLAAIFGAVIGVSNFDPVKRS